MTARPARPAPLNLLPETTGSLPEVSFPEDLWQRVRAQILDRPDSWEELAGDGHWLANHLWPHWAAWLEPLGVTVEDLAGVVAGYSRELWLWLMGERTWAHTVDSLAGRTLRRAPATSIPPQEPQEQR